jgi:histidinol phosphatase-like PHP family hydrolase
MAFRNRRSTIKRWKNVHNDVEVIFGVEWDLLDDEWNCCFDIQWIESDFCVLSCHYKIYSWNIENLTQSYINAIHKYHKKIQFIWHPCLTGTPENFNIEEFAKILNQYQIPIEINCSYLNFNQIDLEKLNKLIHLVEAWVYVNSDLHVLNDFNLRQSWFDYLKQQWFK